MGLTGNRTFVGFGFGAIQAGLFLYEAYHSGAFKCLHVAEILPDSVNSVRSASGFYNLNVAHFDRIEQSRIGPIQIEDPGELEDRTRLVHAISKAQEIATAVPSVENYVSRGEGSLHRVLAKGLRKKVAGAGPKAVIYAAENHNEAAEILRSQVLKEVPDGEREAVDRSVRFLNTAIGKMSGIVTGLDQIRRQSLKPVCDDDRRAFLVEAFNRILVSGTDFSRASSDSGFSRGISVFEEKDELLPFEEAKLYGHNATHALAAYVGALKSVETVAELAQVPAVLDFVRAAFLEESGEALVRKYRGFDPLFTAQGYRQYADDLLRRMLNPYLGDTVERVGRDPIRKLGWNDRLTGTIRLCFREGLEARRYAAGVSAALILLEPSFLTADSPGVDRLHRLWKQESPEEIEVTRVTELVLESARLLRHWVYSGNSLLLEDLFGGITG